MDNEGSHCEEVKADKNYPLTQLPLECPLPTPLSDTTYKYRDFIYEDKFVVTGTFEPVNSQTPTPTHTLTRTPTPGITPTQTPTPDNSPTPTKTVTPTATPPITLSNTHNPRYVFVLEMSMSLDTEAVVYFDIKKREIFIYHAVEGNFPANPVTVEWTVFKDGVVISAGSRDWVIPWKLTVYPTPRLRKILSSTVVKTVVGVFTGLIGLILLNQIKMRIRTPPPKRHPQYSDAFTLPSDIVIPLDNFKFDKGVTPDHITDGGVFVEVYPSAATNYITAIQLIDSSPNRASTTDSYKFQISTSNY